VSGDVTEGGRRRPDAIVVLGAGVEADGSLPPIPRTRVARAVELYDQGIAPRIIVSGLCGLRQEEPPISEAAAMARFATEMGVPESALHLEEESRDTVGNAFFTRERFLGPNGWRSIRVVTSDFHLSRAAWVFRKMLGARYDFSFTSAASGLSPRELIFRSLEECRISIFLNEWLETLEEGNEEAAARLMEHEHPGYADAPTLTHEEMRRRLNEIAHIDAVAGTRHWLASNAPRRERPVGDRRRGERRANGGSST
jgi:uncharacterized SAM-binding protein YcdF (DUF218 family)